ncbi:MAG: DNA polymerase I [Pseudomonadota bacterium]
MQKLILIDGSSYLFRAYHALPPLSNTAGQPTGAIYGVINMLRRIIKDYPDDQVVVVFDPKGDTFRHRLYPAYKANRGETPEDLIAQIEPLYEIIRAMGLPLIIVDDVEADDVIGTLASAADKKGREVIISTGDKDMAQLVNARVHLINTMTDSKLDIAGVQKKFGVLPEQIIDYLSLIGDSSDNIPGVAKVGPKTAVKWLAHYQSLDNLAKHADEIGGKVGENLRAWLKDMALIRELITIRCDVKLPKEIAAIKQSPTDHHKLAELFKQLEFKAWLKAQLALLATEQTDHAVVKTTEKTADQQQLILTKSAFDHYLLKLKNAKLIAFDTETSSLDDFVAELIGVSFSFNGHDGVYIPLAHDYIDTPQQLDRDWVLRQLKPILENPDIKKIGQNLKYDKKVLMNYAIDLRGIAFDTMLESYVYNSTATRHDMDSLALHYLNYHCISYEDVCGKGAKQIGFSQVDINKAAAYAAEDADVTYQLHQQLWPALAKDPALKKVFETIEMPLLDVLTEMERYGVLIDSHYLNQQSQALAERLTALEQSAYKAAEVCFNMNSPKQLREILFDKQGLPVLKKTKTGQPSTAEDVLQDLALDFALPKIILDYRSLSKLKSTYTDRLPQQVQAKTGRVHTSYHQAVASTGRLSSANPNLQNIPIRSTEGQKIRQAFIAPKGYKIMAADYSQIELRIMAHLSDDAGLKQAFAEQQDIHSATAAQVFGVPLATVNAEQRRKAKAINFGLIYGMSAFGLAKQIHVDRNTAQSYIDTYFKRYPGIKAYMTRTQALANDKGYVETLFGRRLYLPEIKASNKMRRMAAERIAINAPMQGTAADIIKIAMIHIYQWLNKNHVDAKMVMQVHDELVFEVAEKEIDMAREKVKYLMESAGELSVPLIVDIGVGDNWHEAH